MPRAWPRACLRWRIRDLGEAINKAGAQRMLSQRMAKAWPLALPDIEGRARKILDASRQRFDQQLAELRSLAPTPEIASTYEQLGKQAAVLKQRLDELPVTPARVNARDPAGGRGAQTRTSGHRPVGKTLRRGQRQADQPGRPPAHVSQRLAMPTWLRSMAWTAR